MHDHPLTHKLILGSVQFGMHYGISNELGSPDENELSAILEKAHQAGIQFIDTAAAYGSAEERLGKTTRANFNFISKLKPGIRSHELASALDESLNKLQVKKLSGLMLHSFEDYLNDRPIWEALEALRDSGKVDSIGFSLYKPEQLRIAVEDGNIPNIIQVPYNLYDRRFEFSLDMIQKHSIQLHVRSVFLQGLMFLSADELGSHFKAIQEKHRRFHALREELGLSVIGACLAFVLSKSWIDHLVIGVNISSQLTELIDELKNVDPAGLEAFDFMKEDDERIINPSLWKS